MISEVMICLLLGPPEVSGWLCSSLTVLPWGARERAWATLTPNPDKFYELSIWGFDYNFTNYEGLGWAGRVASAHERAAACAACAACASSLALAWACARVRRGAPGCTRAAGHVHVMMERVTSCLRGRARSYD